MRVCRYTPKQSGDNGNIGDYEVYITTSYGEPGEYRQVAAGTWPDDQSVKTVTWQPINGVESVKLVAVTEAGARGPWSAAAELAVLGYD